MEIILVRHGQPVASENTKVTASGFGRWVQNYDKSLVAKHSLPNKQELMDLDQYFVVSSALKRAVHSAQLLTNESPQQQLSLLNEMEIPRYKLPFTLKAWTWLYLCRLLWMFGKKGKFESFKKAKQRARLATNKLISLADEQQKVLVFGHGVMNLYVRKNLVKQGWKVVEKNNKYWGVTRLVYCV